MRIRQEVFGKGKYEMERIVVVWAEDGSLKVMVGNGEEAVEVKT